MGRRRDEDDDDDYDYDRPRGRSRRDEEDEDERPRKRRRRGDDGPFDEVFASSPLPLLILFSVFFCCIGLVMSILVLATGKDPVARKNAQMCLIASVGGFFFWLIVRVGLLMLRIW